MNITQKQKGILFMILSALSFASMQVVDRLSREIPTMEQICVRDRFFLHYPEETWFLLWSEKVSAVSLWPFVLRIPWADYPVLRIQPCGAGRCPSVK